MHLIIESYDHIIIGPGFEPQFKTANPLVTFDTSVSGVMFGAWIWEVSGVEDQVHSRLVESAKCLPQHILLNLDTRMQTEGGSGGGIPNSHASSARPTSDNTNSWSQYRKSQGEVNY